MMDYKRMAEIVTKEVDSRLEKKRKRTILVKRISFSVSGICAAIIMCVGILHNDDIKNAFRNKDALLGTPDTIISDIDTITSQSAAANIPVTTAADNEISFNSITTNTEMQVSSYIVTVAQTSSFNISDTNIYSENITTNENICTAVSIAETLPVTTEKNVAATAVTSSVTTEQLTETIVNTSEATTEKTVTKILETTVVITTTGNINHRPTTTAINENEYYFNIKVIDKNTKKKVDNVHLILERQEAIIYDTWTNDYEFIGERETVAEWNTSDINPFISDTYTFVTDENTFIDYQNAITAYKENYIPGISEEKKIGYHGLIYFLTSDKLPDGYKTNFYNDVFLTQFTEPVFCGCDSFIIELKKST